MHCLLTSVDLRDSRHPVSVEFLFALFAFSSQNSTLDVNSTISVSGAVICCAPSDLMAFCLVCRLFNVSFRKLLCCSNRC